MKLDAKLGAGRKLDRSLIPPELQDLVSMVEKWAFQRLDDQDAFIRFIAAEHPDELGAFNRQIDSRRSEISAWGERLSEIHPADAPDHSYWAFLSVLKLREASGPSTDPDEIREINAMKERLAKEFCIERFKAAAQAADDAVREGNFAGYAEILLPFEGLLSATQQNKLRIARNRASH